MKNFVEGTLNENEFYVSEQSLPVEIPAADLLDRLRDSRTTGQLTYHFIEGGIRSVMLTRKTRLGASVVTKKRNFPRQT
jgi:hypothetical protein